MRLNPRKYNREDSCSMMIVMYRNKANQSQVDLILLQCGIQQARHARPARSPCALRPICSENTAEFIDTTKELPTSVTEP